MSRRFDTFHPLAVDLARRAQVVRRDPHGGAGRVALITGGVCSGKTAALQQISETAVAARLHVRGARACSSQREKPWALARQLADFPETHENTAEPGPVLWAELRADARQCGLVVVIDDFQWADLASTQWLVRVVQRSAALPLLVVLGMCPGGRAHGAEHVVDLVQRADRIELTRLAEWETAAYLNQSLNRPVPDEVVATIHDAVGGNRGMLEQLVRIVTLAGLPHEPGAQAELVRMHAAEMARPLVDRVGVEGPEFVEACQALAVLGTADLDTVAASLGVSPVRAVTILGGLVGMGLVTGGPAWSLAQPIVREAFAGQVADRDRYLRRAAWHNHVRGDAALVVARRLAAMSGAVGQPWAAGCLQSAATTGDVRESTRFLRKALAEPLAESARGSTLAAVCAAEAISDPVSAIDRLSRDLGSIHEPRLAVAVRLALANAYYLVRGASAAINVLDGPAGEPEQVQLVSLCRQYLAGGKGCDGKLDGVPATRRVGRLAGLLRARAWTRLGTNAAASVALAGDALSEWRYGDALEWWVFEAAVWVLAVAEEWELVRLHCRPGMRKEQSDVRAPDAFSAIGDAYAQHQLGQLMGAQTGAEKALYRLDGLRVPPDSPLCHEAAGLLAEVRYDGGDPDGAFDLLAGRSLLGTSPTCLPYRALPHRGRLRLAAGDAAGAHSDFLAYGAWADARGEVGPAAARWRSDAALSALALGQREKARRLAAEVVNLATAWGKPLAQGRSLRVAGIAAGDAPGVRLLREAAETLDASPAALDRGRTHLDLGRALRSYGDTKAAVRHFGVAADLFDACGAKGMLVSARKEQEQEHAAGPVVPVRRRDDAGLTPHQHRIARLVTSGNSNREIAELLRVSTRAVEFQLTNIYRSLGISRRAQLAGALEIKL